MAEQSQPAKGRPTAPPPDDVLDSIPGIGIIRVRALRKAGFGSISALRRATMPDLLAVPGLTEAKARLILDHVHGVGDPATACGKAGQTAATSPPPDTPPEPISPAPASAGVNARDAAPRSVQPAPVPAAHVRTPSPAAPPPPSDLQAAIGRVAHAGRELLASEHARAIDKRLARQVSKWVALTQEMAPGDLPPTAGRRTSARLVDLCAGLSDAAAAGLGRKRQEQLADELKDLRHRLFVEGDR
jgi:hypothetical protein